MKKYNICKNGESIRIVFIYQVASFWPSWDSLLRFCLKDPRFNPVILLLREHGIEKQQMQTAESFILSLGLPYEDFDKFNLDAFNPHYAVYQTPYEMGHRGGNIDSWSACLRRKGIKIVYIPYGIEIADTESAMFAHFGSTVIMNSFRVYTISEEMKDEYIKHCSNSKAVRAFGLPKFDSLYNSNGFTLPDLVINKISNRPIVLWKVHFPKTINVNGENHQVSPDLDEYIKFANDLSKYSNLFFIFCPHPKFTAVGDELAKEKTLELIRILMDKENVWIDETDDYRPSLLSADAIMVDRSSLMVEAAAVGVPVLYLRNQEYEEPLTMPIKRLVNSYYQGVSADDMNRFIEMFLEGADEKKELRETCIKNVIPFIDGKCGQRIAEDLLSSVNEEDDIPVSYSLYGARIVIWGTGNISRKMQYLLYYAEKRNLFKVISYIDSDANKWGTIFQNKMVNSPQDLDLLNYDYIVVATEIYFNEILLSLMENGIPSKKIICFDRFLMELKEL